MLARKRFGQNFLIHQGTIDGIVRSLEPGPTDTVLEIGPGLGFLTRNLLPKVKHLSAVELERGMVEYLSRYVEQAPPQNATFELIHDDIMAFDLSRIPGERFKVVGNLPYNITSGVLFKFAGEMTQTDMALRQRIQQMTFMVQKEVGERIVAKPGSKTYGPLSIALQFWFECQLEFFVPPEAFEPRPKVHSVVITLYPRTSPVCEVGDVALMQKLVRTTFQQRRKMLRNSLMHETGLNEEQVLQVLANCEIPPTERPEQLPISAFARLSNAVQALKQGENV